MVYKECTFHPKINGISKVLEGNVRAHQCNCHKPAEIYQFKPEINQKSRVLASNPTVLTTKKSKQNLISKVKMEQ